MFIVWLWLWWSCDSVTNTMCVCYSLSEQMTPAANRADVFWQVTVLWRWHWLRDISSPVHFTPLMTMSVKLLLSQYHVSLANVHEKHKQTNTDVMSSSAWRKSYGCKFIALTPADWTGKQTHIQPIKWKYDFPLLPSYLYCVYATFTLTFDPTWLSWNRKITWK